jgi:hypothetical protein
MATMQPQIVYQLDIPEIYDPRAVFRLVKWLAFAALVALSLGALCAGAAFISDEYGYNLMEAGVVIVSAAASILAIDVLILVFSLCLRRLSVLLTGLEQRRLQAFARGKPDVDANTCLSSEARREWVPFSSTLWRKRKSGITKHQPARHPVGSCEAQERFGFRKTIGILTFLPAFVSSLALAAYLLLPQYRIVEPFTGIRSVAAIVKGLAGHDHAFANAESLVALAIPPALLTLLLLFSDRRYRAGLLAWLTTMALMTTLFVANTAKQNSARLSTESEALVGFSHGFWVVGALLLIMPVAVVLSAHAVRRK